MLARGISITFVSIAAVIASPSISSAQSEPAGDMPRMNFPVTMSAYPIQAMLGNEEGRVVLIVTIEENGQMSNARVETSSGHPTLDDAAIAVVNASSLSAPPTNAAGEPVEVDVLIDVNWELAMESADEFVTESEFEPGMSPPRFNSENGVSIHARDYPAIAVRRGQGGTVAVALTITEDGIPDRISTAHSSGVEALDNAAERIVSRFRWSPATRDGMPVAVTKSLVINFVVSPGRESVQCYAAPVIGGADDVLISGSIMEGNSPQPPATWTVSRWVRVNEEGAVDMALLQTDIGWKKFPEFFVEAFDRDSHFEAHVVDGVPTACWYYRPLFLPLPRQSR